MSIGQQIAGVIHSQPQQPLMEWKGRWWMRGQLADYATRFEQLLQRHGVTLDMAVAVAARNRPGHCFAVLSLLANERPISMLYAFQSAEALARNLIETHFAVLVLDEQDWTEPVALAAQRSGTLVVLLAALPDAPLRVVEPNAQRSKTVHRLPGTGIEILSSGTTGPPKRIFHPSQRLFRSLAGKPPTPQGKPGIVMWPLSGIGGTVSLVGAMLRETSFVLLEKFTPEDAANAVKRHKLNMLPFTPTMVRMFYDANLPREDIASLEYIIGGSGPLDPDLHDKFEARYGTPILWNMGATEFCGTIVAWTLDLYRQHGRAKRGSSGRVLPGCALRIVDPDTGEELPIGAVGLAEVKVDAVGPDWVRTTDLARIDDEGFVFFMGRADGAIIRGGFKIVPEKLCETLRLHPDVAEAAAIGVPDERLGQVPIVVVEPRAGRHPKLAELDAHMRTHLSGPQIPVRYFLVDRLPYTASTKVALGDVRALVARLMSESP